MTDQRARDVATGIFVTVGVGVFILVAVTAGMVWALAAGAGVALFAWALNKSNPDDDPAAPSNLP